MAAKIMEEEREVPLANTYISADRRTMYFIGVTTGSSSINRVFPRWSDFLGLKAVIKGFDFQPDSAPDKYLEAVQFIKEDPNSLGALVTTHKITLLRAARDLFDGLDMYAQLLGEVSCLSKREGSLWGHAKDPITCGHALEAIVDPGYWRRTGGELLVLGAGGSSLALTLYLHTKQAQDSDVPVRITVTDLNPDRLEEMRAIHGEIGLEIPIAYQRMEDARSGDRLVGKLPPGSMVVNATGMGKDSPGSPLSDAASFPEAGIAWDFNYRGELVFLDQARAQAPARNLRVTDGWVYFIHGWTSVIAEVFHIDIPTSGPEFEKLSHIAAEAAGG